MKTRWPIENNGHGGLDEPAMADLNNLSVGLLTGLVPSDSLEHQPGRVKIVVLAPEFTLNGVPVQYET